MKAVDLHVHSTYSDGTDTPSEIVSKALSKGLKAIALTDHDTVEGVDDILSAAAGTGLEIVPGIELSTEYKGKDIHILGLYINTYDKDFLTSLETFRDSREGRNEKMCENLRQMGIDISMDVLRGENPDCVITRSHMGDFLLKHGYVSTKREAFERFIGDHCKAFVPREKISPEMAVTLIKKAGGIAVLAHPILYKMSKAELGILITLLKEKGLDGIEAVYSEYTPADERLIKKYAADCELLLTGGSDYHGSAKPDIDLGCGKGHLFVPEEFLDKLKEHYLMSFRLNFKPEESTLFFDMDGSLLNDDKEISPETYRAIEEAVSKGYLFAISTGRPKTSASALIDRLNLSRFNPVVSAFNGGIVYDYNSGEILHKCTLSDSLSDRLRAFGLNHGVHFHTYSEDEVVCERETEEIGYYSNYVKMPYVIADNCNEYSKEIYKYLFMHMTDKPLLEKLQSEIREDFGDEVQCLFSNDKFLEILPKESGKGNALVKICELTGRNPKATYSFADADNDVSMFKASARSVALLNAYPVAKAAAGYISFTDNNHDGLVPFLNCL